MSRGLLDGFCHGLVDGGAPRGRLHPADVAREFVDFFGLSAFPRMEEIAALLGRAGVGVAASPSLHDGLRGIHTGTRNGPYIIRYAASDGKGAQEHTVLHETYEIIRERLSDLHPRIGLPRDRELCRQADRFAAATLMQPGVFSPLAEAAGLDVVALHRMYGGRAYSSLTLRLAEVMGERSLLAVLYERKEDGDPHLWSDGAAPEAFRAKVVAWTPGFRLTARTGSPSCLLPRRGCPPTPGSVTERVALTGRPVYVERVRGCDLWRAGDVTVAARPVLWQGRLAKVAVVAVPYRERSVLSPQFSRASFEHVREAHGVI